MIPFSDRLTLSTSRVCSSIDMFLWMTPSPPSCASAMASSASVTVSIGEDRIGMFRPIRAVRCDRVSDLVGEQVGITRLEQDVVESDALVGDAVVHREKLRWGPDDLAGTTKTCWDARSIELINFLTDRIERSAGPDQSG